MFPSPHPLCRLSPVPWVNRRLFCCPYGSLWICPGGWEHRDKWLKGRWRGPGSSGAAGCALGVLAWRNLPYYGQIHLCFPSQ